MLSQVVKEKICDQLLSKEEIQWCMLCERTHLRKNWVRCNGCPYSDCNGAIIHAWGWSINRSPFIRRNNYPDVPKRNLRYPLNTPRIQDLVRKILKLKIQMNS